MKNQIQIRLLIEKDIASIPEAFKKIGWNKLASLFEGYLKEQEGENSLFGRLTSRANLPVT